MAYNKYINTFADQSEYEAYTATTGMSYPNIAYIVEEDELVIENGEPSPEPEPQDPCEEDPCSDPSCPDYNPETCESTGCDPCDTEGDCYDQMACDCSTDPCSSPDCPNYNPETCGEQAGYTVTMFNDDYSEEIDPSDYLTLGAGELYCLVLENNGEPMTYLSDYEATAYRVEGGIGGVWVELGETMEQDGNVCLTIDMSGNTSYRVDLHAVGDTSDVYASIIVAAP